MGNLKKGGYVKDKCYDCKYRGDLINNTHSCCYHPEIIYAGYPIIYRFELMPKHVRYPIYEIFTKVNEHASKRLEIKGKEQGINEGWFFWPACFDPVWLVNCDGFEEK